MGSPHIFPLIHREVRHQLKGYIQMAEMDEKIAGYIVPPGLGSQAGVLGSLALAEYALRS